jgi:fructoselysine-6-P-deglycase FrlB-like protein
MVDELRAILPDGRIALAGCGTSFYVAQSAAVLWETGGHGQADSFSASEMPLRPDYDTVVAISRSGTTTEVVDLLHRLGAIRTLALVGVASGPVAAAAAQTLALGFADEKSVVQTRFATSVIALFRALSGDDVDLLADQAAGVLGQPAAGFAGVHRFVFLGTGSGVGLAHEAALKMREAAQTVTESYPAMEYRHGPIALAESGVAVWMLGPPPPGLVDDVLRTGAAVVNDDLDPLVDLLRVQSTAVAIAHAKGLDADHPRHLTRSVQLSEAKSHS